MGGGENIDMDKYTLDLNVDLVKVADDPWELANGTSYKDQFRATYHEVEAVLGEPNSFGDKSNYEWTIRLPKNEVVVIYDYKDNADKDIVKDWHLGARGQKEAEFVKAYFEYVRD